MYVPEFEQWPEPPRFGAGVVHVCGLPISDVTDSRAAEYTLRQRCAWCGVVIFEHHHTDDDIGEHCPTPWAPGARITIDGERKWIEQATYDTRNGGPSNACWKIDPALTA